MTKGIFPVCGNEVQLSPREKLPYTRVTCLTCLAELEAVEVDLVRFSRVIPEEERERS